LEELPPGVRRDLDLEPGVVGVLGGTRAEKDSGFISFLLFISPTTGRPTDLQTRFKETRDCDLLEEGLGLGGLCGGHVAGQRPRHLVRDMFSMKRGK